MFQINDRVKKRHYVACDSTAKFRDPNPVGTVIAINGKFITVRHDEGTEGKLWHTTSISFDYLTDDLEYLNPLLRMVRALGPYDRT